MNKTTSSAPQSLRILGVFDVVAIMVGIIIGSGIFVIPAMVAGLLGSTQMIMWAWFLGGFLSLVGALCYAELASTYPKEGGDYFFLNHAYGEWAGFLYAWGRLWVIHTGNIAMMASIVGIYGSRIVSFSHSEDILSLSAIMILTIINCLGVRGGKWTQNIIVTIQLLGLLSVILAVMFVDAPMSEAAPPIELTFGNMFLALIFVQFCFGGWSDCAFVASEVKRPEKNILRSLIIGTLLVTVLYMLINWSILSVLGEQKAASSEAVIADVLNAGFGEWGGRLVTLVAIFVALASVNGMILTGGRIFHAFGSDYRLFTPFGIRDQQLNTPIFAFMIQSFIAIILVVSGEFEDLVLYTASAHWLFMIAVGISLFVFRFKEPNIERPYKVNLYPIIPIIYIASCAMLFYNAITYEKSRPIIGFLVVLSGIPFYFLSRFLSRGQREGMTTDNDN